MPLVLQRYTDAEQRLLPEGMNIRMAAARGPLVVASWLMGNVPPRDVIGRGTPEQVEAWARECIRKTGGRGLILSAGGDVSPGTPPEGIDALVRPAREE